jgi:hypothetical protein
MLNAITEASGRDAASSLAEIGRRSMSRRRARASDEEMKTKERLATLHPEVTNAPGGDKD